MATRPALSSFPEEILSAIFIDLVAELDTLSASWTPRYAGPAGRPSSARASLAISHVCSTWRSVALSFNLLWCDIDLAHPELAKMCMDLSHPQNVQVFCRDVYQPDFKRPPSHAYLLALERVFRDSERIESLRLSDEPRKCTPHYEHGILPIITRLNARFPALKSFCGMEWEVPFDRSQMWTLNLDHLVKGASETLRELDLPSGSMSFDVLCSLQLTSLTFKSRLLELSATQWRILLGRLAPSLKHLDMPGGDSGPPVLLPNLDTLVVRGSITLSCSNLHVPIATQITFEDYVAYQFHDDLGREFANPINQRLRDSTSLSHPLRLAYTHQTGSILSNPGLVFCIDYPAALRAFSSLCRSLDVRVRDSINQLGLNGLSSTDIQAVDFAECFGEIAEHLPNIEEIWLDEDTAQNFLPWFVRAPIIALFSAVKAIKLSRYREVGEWNIPSTLSVQVMSLRTKSGHPIELLLKKPGINNGFQRMCREGDTVVVDPLY
jgi:hypothetical protein